VNSHPTRRQFLATTLAASAGGWPIAAAREPKVPHELLEASRPSRLAKLPKDFADTVGSTLVRSRYQLTGKPALIEGAEKLLAMGTRLAKFWFDPHRIAQDYPYHSTWPETQSLVGLAETPYWQQVFAMPFSTILLIAQSPPEHGWRDHDDPARLAKITEEFASLTRMLYRDHGHRPLTIILQNWEGDWQLRGTGAAWNPPPDNWKLLCKRFARRLQARQDGVALGRASARPDAKLKVVHAAEVNRVADQWKGIPTMTEHVLPEVELDLVSYSCYDGMANAATLWQGIETIRRYARTSGPFGTKAVCLGEIGIPENLAPEAIGERWDTLLGTALAAKVVCIAQWQLYCNEPDPRTAPHPLPPFTDPRHLRGYWLVRPDGSLSETGKYFSGLWQRARSGE
jgi:hypothetical protein